jgi:hypothetical protein
MKTFILDTYEADLLNESPPRREIIAEVQTDNAELVGYLNPDFAELVVKLLNEHYSNNHATITAPKKFTVIAVSSNTNSFGYKQVCVLHESGEGYALLVQAYGTDKVPVQAYGTDKVPVQGEEVELRESRFYGAPQKLPVTSPEKSKKIIAEAKKTNKK